MAASASPARRAVARAQPLFQEHAGGRRIDVAWPNPPRARAARALPAEDVLGLARRQPLVDGVHLEREAPAELGREALRRFRQPAAGAIHIIRDPDHQDPGLPVPYQPPEPGPVGGAVTRSDDADRP